MAHRNRKSNTKDISLPWLSVGLILAGALALRIYLAFSIAWRPDEIVYVDWLGQWFADHLFAYLTQLHHTLYPPQSPVFANPPLAMWLISLGVAAGRSLDLPLLVAARSVNIAFGFATLITLYFFCIRFFNRKIALGSLAILAFLPLVAANHASAFLDTILGFLLLLTIWQFFVVLAEAVVSYKQLSFLAILIALCMLTKFSMFFILAAIGVTTVVKLLLDKQYAKTAFFIILTFVTPAIVWSGLRDIHHITGVIGYFTSKYATIYAWPGQSVSYFLYLAHDIPTVVLILFLLAIIYTKRQNEGGLIVWLLLFTVLAILNVRIFAPTSYSYQLLPVTPLIIAVAIWTLEQIRPSLRTIGVVLIGLEIVFLNLGQPVAFYTLSQTLLSQVTGINRFVPSGTGSEDLPQLGQYIQKSLPPDARVAAIYNDWTLRKYILPTQSITSLFLNETLETATSRGAGYVVASRYFASESSPIAKELKTLTPLHEVKFGQQVIARIYVIPRQTIPIQSISLAGPWQAVTENATITNLSTDSTNLSADVEFDYVNSSPTRYASLTHLAPVSFSRAASGVALKIYGEGRSKNIYIDLLDSSTGNYRRAAIPLNWHGWHSVEIPFELFTEVQVGTSPLSVDLKKPLELRISIDSADSHQVSFKISDFELVMHENSLR